MHRVLSSSLLFPPCGAIALLVPFLLAGCGGGLYSVDQGEVAQRFIPQERTVHHPDSLRDLTVTEGEEKMQYHLERDYQALIEK